jgi:hypothetical protein
MTTASMTASCVSWPSLLLVLLECLLTLRWRTLLRRRDKRSESDIISAKLDRSSSTPVALKHKDAQPVSRSIATQSLTAAAAAAAAHTNDLVGLKVLFVVRIGRARGWKLNDVGGADRLLAVGGCLHLLPLPG